MKEATASTVYYLEMTDPAKLRPSRQDGSGLRIAKLDPPDAAWNRRMYLEVGADWNWTDWAEMSLSAWREFAERKELSTCLAWDGDEPAGYFELEKHSDDGVELVHFGLLPAYIGRGVGGWLLTEAVRSAWALPKVRRVWLHTCTEDHPRALDNYRARGFTIYKVRGEW